MFQITTTPITTLQYNIVLTDADVNRILVDPSEFQKALRGMRNEQFAAKPDKRHHLRLGKKTKVPLSPKVTPLTMLAKALAHCEKCGKEFTQRGMAKHRNACKGMATAESAE
jgi:hypothetical protein